MYGENIVGKIVTKFCKPESMSEITVCCDSLVTRVYHVYASLNFIYNTHNNFGHNSGMVQLYKIS